MSKSTDDIKKHVDSREEEFFDEDDVEESVTSGDTEVRLKYILFDTTPDADIRYGVAYTFDTWLDAYKRLFELVTEISGSELESYLVSDKAVFSAYSVQTFDKEGIRHLLYIIGTVL